MIDHRYMTKKLLIVILSRDTATKEMESKAMNKKIFKKILFSLFFFFTGFEPVPSGYTSILYSLGWLTKPLSYLGSLYHRYTIHLNTNC